jgi:hypothetical protein
MDGILQRKLGVKIEYNLGEDEVMVDMGGAEGKHYTRLDEIVINPKIVDLYGLDIRKTVIKMDFKAPVICDKSNFNLLSSMMVGVKFEGEDKNKFIEFIEERARSFGPEWDNAVRRRREEILARNKSVR